MEALERGDRVMDSVARRGSGEEEADESTCNSKVVGPCFSVFCPLSRAYSEDF